ncbi:MAG: ankyrin repeat domain-containing protein [Deltaproteobacteria bacterium]
MKRPKTYLGFVLSLMILTGLLAGCAAPLYEAAERGDMNGVRKLLDQGADINETSENGTALRAAAATGRIDIMQYLLDRGADINLGAAWWTPLSAASASGQLEAVRLLLDRGADINAKSPAVGYTALWWAAYRGQTKVVQLLLDRGSDCCETAARELSSYDTPLKAAKKHGHDAIVRLLQQAEARQLGTTSPTVASPAAAAPVPQTSVSFPASDVDTPPSINVKTNANAYAIVIGIEQYRQKLPRADYATHDARIVTDYLTKALGYPEENVVTLLNEHASNVDFVKYFEKWLLNNADKGSTVFVYFSGHGAPDPKSGGAYLVPYDGDPSFIAETGYSLKRMYDALGKLPAKEIVVALDSCFSGAGGRSVLAKGARPLVMNLGSIPVTAANMTIIAAASRDQISSTYGEKGHGLFTYFMLKGIKNEDVVYQDGSIAVSDLFSYIKPQVERIARKQYNNEQSPQLIEPKKD